MTATSTQIDRVRRMTAEKGTENYLDKDIAAYIESYPLLDAAGNLPGSARWSPTYDLFAAAGDIWSEKAAELVADGQIYAADSAHLQAMRQARYCRALRSAITRTLTPMYPALEANDE